jgi:hypothetical protein
MNDNMPHKSQLTMAADRLNWIRKGMEPLPSSEPVAVPPPISTTC